MVASPPYCKTASQAIGLHGYKLKICKTSAHGQMEVRGKWQLAAPWNEMMSEKCSIKSWKQNNLRFSQVDRRTQDETLMMAKHKVSACKSCFCPRQLCTYNLNIRNRQNLTDENMATLPNGGKLWNSPCMLLPTLALWKMVHKLLYPVFGECIRCYLTRQ